MTAAVLDLRSDRGVIGTVALPPPRLAAGEGAQLILGAEFTVADALVALQVLARSQAPEIRDLGGPGPRAVACCVSWLRVADALGLAVTGMRPYPGGRRVVATTPMGAAEGEVHGVAAQWIRDGGDVPPELILALSIPRRTREITELARAR